MAKNAIVNSIAICCAVGLTAASGFVAWNMNNGDHSTSEQHSRFFDRVASIYDLNSDGYVTLTEIHETVPRHLASPAQIQVRFHQMDIDRDGWLSVRDVDRSYTAFARYLDHNKNGRIDERELADIRTLFE